MKHATAPLLRGKAHLAYLHEHVKPSVNLGKGFYNVVKPIYAFKKAPYSRIVNLVIPVDARVFFNSNGSCIDDRKMRADKAIVHSIVRIVDHNEYDKAFSMHDTNFLYHKGETVVPTRQFCIEPMQCASGIHFFLNLKDAMQY